MLVFLHFTHAAEMQYLSSLASSKLLIRVSFVHPLCSCDIGGTAVNQYEAEPFEFFRKPPPHIAWRCEEPSEKMFKNVDLVASVGLHTQEGRQAQHAVDEPSHQPRPTTQLCLLVWCIRTALYPFPLSCCA